MLLQYEAEKGSRTDGSDVRFSSDATAFPDFSWKGFVVFSPIQDEIIIHVDSKEEAIFHILAHYKSPKETMVDVTFKPVGDMKPTLGN